MQRRRRTRAPRLKACGCSHPGNRRACRCSGRAHRASSPLESYTFRPRFRPARRSCACPDPAAFARPAPGPVSTRRPTFCRETAPSTGGLSRPDPNRKVQSRSGHLEKRRAEANSAALLCPAPSQFQRRTKESGRMRLQTEFCGEFPCVLRAITLDVKCDPVL